MFFEGNRESVKSLVCWGHIWILYIHWYVCWLSFWVVIDPKNNLLKVTFYGNVDVKADVKINKSLSGSPEPIFDASKINNKHSPWLSDSTVNWDSLSILIMISDKQRRAKFTLILFTKRRHVGRGGTILLRFLIVLHEVTTCFTSL